MKSRDKNIKNVIILGIAIIVMTIGFILLYDRNVQKQHEYYCDKFILHMDKQEIDLKQIDSNILSVVELLPITNDDIAVVCRIDENTNLLSVYNFRKKDFIFQAYGSQMAWIQDKYSSLLYFKDDTVYDTNNEVIFKPDLGKHISIIEYVGEEFMITVVDKSYKNASQIYIK